MSLKDFFQIHSLVSRYPGWSLFHSVHIDPSSNIVFFVQRITDDPLLEILSQTPTRQSRIPLD